MHIKIETKTQAEHNLKGGENNGENEKGQEDCSRKAPHAQSTRRET